MCEKASFRVFEERLTRLVNMDSSEGGDGRLFMESWHFWKYHIACVEDVAFGGCLLCCLLFCLFLFSPILIHQSALRYFSSGGVYSRIWIKTPPWGYIIYQYHLILLQYQHAFFPRLFNRGDGSFPRSVIRCRPEDNAPWWLLTTLCSEYNHRIIGPGHL